MPRPSDPARRPPDDFARMLSAPEPLLLVGGQAINLWAIHYQEQTRDLAPFVSCDADVLGDRGTLELLGRISGAKPQMFPMKPPSNEVGVVVVTDSGGRAILIEVLRHVRGVTNDELRDPVYEFAVGAAEVRVRIPGPIALLKAKMANLAEINQNGRQDARHILILARLLPAYLADLRSSTAAGKLEERKLVEFLERLLAVVVSDHGRQACTALNLRAHDFYSGLDPAGLPKLTAFLKKRLPRVLKKGGPRRATIR